MDTPLQKLQAMGDGLAREIRCGTRHLHERQLERQPWVAALAHVVDRDGEQVAEPQNGRLAELVPLLVQPFTHLFGHGQRIRHMAHVLHKQHVSQMLE